MMITIAIVVLVSGVILLQYSSFNNSVLLKNQAYITAFDFRDAQSRAVSIRGQGGQFREEYGLYFHAGKKNQYLLFQDVGSDAVAKYDAGEEVAVAYRIDPRFEITNICVTRSSVQSCGLSELSVSYQRPNFDANFHAHGAGSNSIQSAEITISTLNGASSRIIKVWKTGQISVE
jgi:hypothetical protein